VALLGRFCFTLLRCLRDTNAANRYNEGAMVRQLEAVYEHGVLRPLEPLALPEHQRVRLTLEDQAVPQNGATPVAAPVNDRREEFQWLAKESGAYAGQWVALDGSRLVAHGMELATVSAAARAAGVERPLLTHLPPGGDLPFGSW
jgi:predicted DNA-binding antitoxin AbrB/MazE fold protein